MPLLLICATNPQSNKDTNKIQPHPPPHCKLGLYSPYPSINCIDLNIWPRKWPIYAKLPGLKTEQSRSNCINRKQWEKRYHHFGIRYPPLEETPVTHRSRQGWRNIFVVCIQLVMTHGLMQGTARYTHIQTILLVLWIGNLPFRIS